MEDSTPHSHRAFFAILLVTVTGITFVNCLANGFVDWDDHIYLINNPAMQGSLFEGLRTAFSSFVSGNYHPLPIFTYVIEKSIFGLSSFVSHLTNILIHISCSVLIFYLTSSRGHKYSICFLSACLFALHPMRTEAVAWVTGRKDLLCAFFSLTSLGFYFRYLATTRRSSYAASLALFFLALLSKGTAVAFPVILILHDFVSRRSTTVKTWAEKVPFILLSIIFAAIGLTARASYQGVLNEAPFELFDRLSQGAYRGVFYYLTRALVPVPSLVSPYPPPQQPLQSTLIFLAWVISALLVLAFLLSAQKKRRVAWGLGFSVIMLSTSLPFPVLGYSADRFSYLPAFGLSCLFAEGVQALHGRLRPARLRGLFLPLVLLPMVGLAAITWKQCETWRDSVSLWTEAIRTYSGWNEDPKNLALAHVYRGRALREEGRPEAALVDLEYAIDLDPESAASHTEMGITFDALGRPGPALKALDTALRLAPEDARAYYHRGILRRNVGDLEGSAADLSKATADPAHVARALSQRGITRAAQGDLAQAVADFSEAIDIAPSTAELYVNRGIARVSYGTPEGAIIDFETALRIQPTNIGAHFGLGVANLQADRPLAAVNAFTGLLRLDPGHLEALKKRGETYLRLGEEGRALPDLQAAAQAGDPDAIQLLEEAQTRPGNSLHNQK
ncbi:MAG: tetratricopeptide repeat protein [Deferrisomatales bacterium]|nr:tetratricopeptide repeat protein [Deferrisomatales bacterium]